MLVGLVITKEESPLCCVMDISTVSMPVSVLHSALAISSQRAPKGNHYLLSLGKSHPLHTGLLYSGPSP